MTEVYRGLPDSQHELVRRCHNWVMKAAFQILIVYFALQITSYTRECRIFLTASIYVHIHVFSNEMSVMWTKPPHCWGFAITMRRITVGGTSLGKGSAQRRDLYLTTHNTHKRQTIHASGGIRIHNPSMRAALRTTREKARQPRSAEYLYTVKRTMIQRTVFINKIRMLQRTQMLQRTRWNTIGRRNTHVLMTCSILVFNG